MKEHWQPIPGTESAYWVSNLGRVKSYRGRNFPCTYLKPGLASNGYLTVSLFRKTRTVHSLVAEAFIGPRPKGSDICHLNGKRTDNRASNLRYDTRKGNFADMDKHGTRPRGSQKPRSKLTEGQARVIRDSKGRISQKALAYLYNVSPACVQAIHDGRTWKHA